MEVINMKETTQVNISMELHKKAKIIAALTETTLTEFYNTAIIGYISKIENENKIVKKHFQS
jgi:hypothetical protein